MSVNNDAQKSKVDSDLENRLDTLFDDDDQAEKPLASHGPSEDPLDELKSLVMSIEWEITDDVMARFISQVELLKTRFEEDRIIVMFLQLLGSLGLYVKTNKGKAHTIAFKLLNSVYNSFETAVSPGKISPSEKKKLLYVELNKYKELKEQIDATRGGETEPPHGPATTAGLTNGRGKKDRASYEAAPTGNPSQASAIVTQKHFDEVMDAFKSMLRKELNSIREDIARLAKNK
jgi:hypothetical protein